MTNKQQRTVLIYCPNTGGHRHMYAKTFASYFIDRHYHIVFAHCGLLEQTKPKWTFTSHDSTFLKSFLEHPNVLSVNLQKGFQSRRQLSLICSLQAKHNPDQTIIIDGDAIQWQLASQVLPWRPRMKQPTAAVFIMSEFIYPCAVSVSQLLSQWWLHGFLFRKFQLLANHIWLDEILVNSLSAPHYTFVPELLSEADPKKQSEKDRNFEQRISKEFEQFLSNHPDKTAVLSFGEWESRKGIDFLARLVVEDPHLLFVRVGRMKPANRLSWEMVSSWETLHKQNRVFDVPCYIDSPTLIQTFFSHAKIIALPYRKFYRTSASMLLALQNGKPILVPNQGLLQFRTETHGVGLTYKKGDYRSFREQFYKLQDTADQYTKAIESYTEEFTQTAVHRIFDRIFSPGTEQVPTSPKLQIPNWTMWDLLLWRLCLSCPPLRPLFLGIRNIRHRIRAKKHEHYVHGKWRSLANQQVAIYGAGKHTQWLNRIVRNIKPAPNVTAILDDTPQSEISFWDCTVSATDQWKADCPVILSSDTMQQRMKDNLEEQFGPAITVIDLYADLPAGPYPKRKFPKTPKAHP